MRKIVIGLVIGLALAGCGGAGSSSLAQKVAPGSAVVPCSRIGPLVKYLLPYADNLNTPKYLSPGAAVFRAEQTLNGMFDNVSNLDPPLRLSGAETTYESDWMFVDLSPNIPMSGQLDTDIDVLGSACGWSAALVDGRAVITSS